MRKLHLSPVMDLLDRQVISYTLGSSPNLALTNTALREALSSLGQGQHPLVHSDQGFQYQHSSWRKTLRSVGAAQSMSRKGNCYHNSAVENFFGHLKEELLHRGTFTSVETLTAELHESLIQPRTHLNNTEGPEPGPIPSPGPQDHHQLAFARRIGA